MNKQIEHTVDVLERIFNALFNCSEKTELRSGGEEPIYLPSTNINQLHAIISRDDYFSSALHEVSHWCIAGKERRKLIDFGYWYEPDGRSTDKQAEFEWVEVKPQALEWVFTEACGLRFHLSLDNLALLSHDQKNANSQEYQEYIGPSDAFKQAVVAQAKAYSNPDEIPIRAKAFMVALLTEFQPNVNKIKESAFSLQFLV